MKDFQLNYTTPEQSKWLLKLGVPADSADMKYYEYYGITDKCVPYFLPPGLPYSRSITGALNLPCWSVGRLIEIYLTCALKYHPYDDFYTETPSLHFMAFDKDRLIEEVIEIMSEDEMDFSKLEDFIKRSNGDVC